ncbi:hypothetical protein C8R44DRAFT_862194 [Mycena epipterygia]|nr:hypothetical protein C8R44DRAFT_862194 [Mycena epipterygia]
MDADVAYLIFNIIKSLAASATPASGDAICRSLKTIIACHGITHTQLVDILVSRNPRVFSKELVIRVRDVSKWDKYELEWYEREGEVLCRLPPVSLVNKEQEGLNICLPPQNRLRPAIVHMCLTRCICKCSRHQPTGKTTTRNARHYPVWLESGQRL